MPDTSPSCELLRAYVDAIDAGDQTRLQELFSADASVRIMDAHGEVDVMTGRDAIVATLIGTLARHAEQGERRRHYVATPVDLGQVDEGIVAAVTTFVVLRSPRDRPEETSVASVGEYVDRIRTQPEPAFAERLIKVRRFP